MEFPSPEEKCPIGPFFVQSVICQSYMTIMCCRQTPAQLTKENRKTSLAYRALKQIQAIYREENKLCDMTSEERLE